MSAVVLRTSSAFNIPAGLDTHRKFLDWLAVTDVPEELRVGFINGEVWVDTMSERAFAHNRMKTVVARVLDQFVTAERLGVFFGDGMTYSAEHANFTAVPDGIFVSRATIGAGRVQLAGAKRDENDTRLVGTPDLTVEVVSDHSVFKDTEWLVAGYWNAGVAEYWVIDARRAEPKFAIHRRGAKGYTAVRPAGGWIKSPVFDRSFRFVAGKVLLGKQAFQLEVASR
jgi:Uma2 family endonuclease